MLFAKRAPEERPEGWNYRRIVDHTNAVMDVIAIRATPGGENLSHEMCLLLCLIAFDGYILFPSKAMRENLEAIDRRTQYTDCSPDTLLRQLNENWHQLRLLKNAMADRDRVISQLHESIKQRDEVIKDLRSRLRYARAKLALLWSVVGGAAAKGVELGGMALLHWRIH